MTEKTINQFTALSGSLALGDEVGVWDASVPGTRRATIQAIFDLMKATAHSWTAAQTITSPAAGTVGLTVNSAVSASTVTMEATYNGTSTGKFQVDLQAATRAIRLTSFDNGASYGTSLFLQRNSNGSTPAAGYLMMHNLSGTAYRLWPDASGNLRIWTADPTNANDTGGTVVGTQTSWHEAKEDVEEWDGAEALEAIRNLTLYSYKMRAESQLTTDGEKPTYHGIVIQDEDREANAWFGLGYGENQIPALNDRSLFGYMLAAIRTGANIIGDLQGRVAALEA